MMLECWTRYPGNTTRLPVSIRTGTETIVERSGKRSRSAMSSGMSATGTAWSNCATAIR